MDRTETLLKELTEAFGPPGFEDDVRSIVKRELARADEILTDRLGSLIAVKRGNQEHPKILFAAHMDEVGLMVKGFTKEGFVKFEPLGGWLPTELIGERVIVRTRKGDYPGVVGTLPPHLKRGEEAKKPPELKELYIDFGVSEGFNPVKELDIRIGDPIAPFSTFQITGNPNVFISKAFDDRVGVAHLLRVMDEIQDLKDHPNTVYLAAVVQEEVGLRGAGTTSWVVEPDVAIAVDVSLAEDIPGLESYTNAKFGKGVSIVVQDRTMIANRRFRDYLVALAEQHQIPYHLVTVRGGYDTGRIHRSRAGVPSAILGIPSRYIHGFNSMIHKGDFESAVRLAAALIEDLDEKKVEDFIAY